MDNPFLTSWYNEYVQLFGKEPDLAEFFKFLNQIIQKEFDYMKQRDETEKNEKL